MDSNYRMVLLWMCFILSLAALGRTDTDWCLETLSCLSQKITDAGARNDAAQICREQAEMVRCMEDRNSRCDSPDMAEMNRGQIDIFKKSAAAKCVPNNKVPFKQCEQEFLACYKPPSDDPSSNASLEYHCSQHPIFLNCMQQSLSKCDVQGPDGKKVDKLEMTLKGFEKKFRTEKTNCKTDCDKDPAAADCNHSSSLVTSLIHTVFVIVIAVLLH